MILKFNTFINDLNYALKLSIKCSKKYIFFKLLISIINSILTLINLIWLKALLDSIIDLDLYTLSIKVTIYGCTVFLLNFIVNLLNNKYIEIEKEKFSAKIDYILYDSMSEKNIRDFDDPEFYNIYTFVMRFGKQNIFSLVNELVDSFGYILSLFAIGGIIIIYDFILLIPIVINVLVTIFLDVSISSNLHKKDIDITKNSRLLDYFNRQFYLKALAEEMKTTPILQMFKVKHKRIIKKNISIIERYSKKFNLLQNIQGLISILFQISTILILASKVVLNKILFTDFLILFNSVIQLNNTILLVVDSIPTIYSDCLYINDFVQFKVDGNKEIPRAIQNINTIFLDKVCFSYNNKKNIFLSLNISFMKGKLNVICGENGSGKSTLMKLICGLYSPKHGRIMINGNSVESKVLEASSSFLSQEYQIYPISIIQNILLKESYKEEEFLELKEILKIFGLDKKIERLEYGYETILTDEFALNNEKFSKGELQSIAIARTLMQKKEIIILDEPFSSLDHKSENNLLDFLRRLASFNLVFIITHKTKNIHSCDCTYFLKNGIILKNVE